MDQAAHSFLPFADGNFNDMQLYADRQHIRLKLHAGKCINCPNFLDLQQQQASSTKRQ